MDNICVVNTLRLLQSADEIKARLTGEFSSVHGLSVNEFFLMLHLEQAPLNRLSRVELARRMHLSASTVTRMATPMEKIGLLDRQVDERDARYSFVALTEAGKTKLAEARLTFSKRAETIFKDRWNESELEQFGELLYRLIVGTPANLT